MSYGITLKSNNGTVTVDTVSGDVPDGTFQLSGHEDTTHSSLYVTTPSGNQVGSTSPKASSQPAVPTTDELVTFFEDLVTLYVATQNQGTNTATTTVAPTTAAEVPDLRYQQVVIDSPASVPPTSPPPSDSATLTSGDSSTAAAESTQPSTLVSGDNTGATQSPPENPSTLKVVP